MQNFHYMRLPETGVNAEPVTAGSPVQACSVSQYEKWVHEDKRQQLQQIVGCWVDNQRSIPGRETTVTVGLNRDGEVTESWPRTSIYCGD
jgi:hypothetical protein